MENTNVFDFLIPTPRTVRIFEGKYSLPNILKLFVNQTTHTELELGFKKIINLFKDGNIKIKINIVNLPDWYFSLGNISYTGLQNKYLPKEGYKIVVKDGIKILSNDKAGCFYAIQTLGQIIKLSEEIPHVEIIDYPEYSFRGFQLDLARQMESMKTIENMIDIMANYKMNQVYFYIENAFRYKCCKEVVSKDALTPQEIKHIVDFAKERCMEVIPSLNLFSHMEWLLRHPKYKFLSEYRDKKAYRKHFAGDYVICPSLPQSWELIESMIDEWIPIIDTLYINVNLDEVWMIGCCDKCKTIREKFGEGKIYLDHILKLHRLLKERGKRMMMAPDMVFYWPEILKEIPKDVIMVDWYYEPMPDKTTVPFLNWKKISTTEILKKHGFDVIALPCTEVQNIYTFRKYAEKFNVNGFCISQWEYTNGFIQECICGNVYGAECSWSFNPKPPEVFSKYFGKNFFGVTDIGLEALFILLPNKYTFQPNEKYIFDNILRYRIDSSNNEFTGKYALLSDIADNIIKKYKDLSKKEILDTFKLKVNRWFAIGTIDRIINEIAMNIRDILRNRKDEEMLSKLEWKIKELEKMNKLFLESYHLAKKLWEIYRNGIKPKGNFPDVILDVSELLEELLAKLKKFINNPQTKNIPFKDNLLIIDFMFPEANNFQFFIEESKDGRIWKKVYLGGVCRPLFPQIDLTKARTITEVFKSKNRLLPKFIKIGSDGFTQFGIRTVKLVNVFEEKMPVKIIKIEGNIYFPENLLYDDTKFTLFNKQGVADIFYNPEKIKESYIILKFF